MPVETPHPLTGKTAPLIAGHECSGVVAAIGSDVKGYHLGDRVVTDSATWCGDCYKCKKSWYSLCEKCAFLGLSRDGVYSEFVNVPASSVAMLPDNVSFEWGATAEPFACALHTIYRSRIMIGETIVVIGTGPIGLMCAHLALLAGVGKVYVIARTEFKKEVVKKMGAISLDPATEDIVGIIKSETQGQGADVALEVVGTEEAIDLSLKVVRTRGRVVLVGFPEKKPMVDWNNILYKELDIIGVLNNGGEIPRVLELMANRMINPNFFITGCIGLSNIIEDGYKVLKDKNEHIKILVDPSL